MPPAVAAAAVEVAGALGGAALANRGAGRAAAAQERGSREALAFERERFAAEQEEKRRALALQERQWNAREAARVALGRRYGIDLAPGQTHIGGPGGAAPPPRTAPGAAAMAAPMMTVGAMSADPAEEDIVFDPENWNQWGAR